MSDIRAFAELIEDFVLIGIMESPEREELPSSSQASPVSSQEQERRDTSQRNCLYVQQQMNTMLDCDNEFGEGLMSLMEDAEKISRERSCEGYYLAACHKFKQINEVRGRLVMSARGIIQHHNDTSAEKHMAKMRTHYESQLRQQRLTHDEMMSVRMNRISRLEEELRRTEAEVRRREQDAFRLNSELTMYRVRAKTFRRLVKHLNCRIREMTKAARRALPAPNSPQPTTKCHFLGTYDDVLMSPI